MTSQRDEANDIRRTLTDPRSLCATLGLDEGSKPQAGGLFIRCVWHAERTPSCSVRLGPDHTIAANCFACGQGGDALSLIAAAHGLDVRKDFVRVLEIARDLAGTAAPIRRAATMVSTPAKPYPPTAEVQAFWRACLPVLDHTAVSGWLDMRLGRPVSGDVELRDLVRALPPGEPPRWARFDGRTWADTGNLAIVPMFDVNGTMRSFRARRVIDGDSPKSLPPSGFRASELVFADALARVVLATGHAPDIWPKGQPFKALVMEGELDYITAACDYSDADASAPAIFGLTSGSWTREVASRIPSGTEVRIFTDLDQAGEQYAESVIESLRGRCRLFRTDGAALMRLLARQEEGSGP